MFSCYAMSNNDDDLYIHLQIIAIEYIHLQTHITDNMNNKLADLKTVNWTHARSLKHPQTLSLLPNQMDNNA
jgi:hypothetical protein